MEIELKLALPGNHPEELAARLAQLPLLARRKAVQQHLHNIYYDTPQQDLNRLRVALRLRRVGASAGASPWLQTLKIGGSSESALSQRGEWETAVAGPQLDAQALQATPWHTLDPDGRLYPALAPCFTTAFVRTTWTVRSRDGSAVEVALDRGHIAVDGKTAPLCELELELLAGEPVALFRVAAQIAQAIPTLPLGASKAQRGYALARDAAYAPQLARPPALNAHLSLAEAGQRVLREAFSHYTANLHGLLHSDDPELVHQARVGWRRFKTGLQCFKPLAGAAAPPLLQALEPVRGALGALRDLDVARQQTLPMLAHAYTAGVPQRQAHWQALEQALAQAADQQRQTLRAALADPRVGAALLATTRWLEMDLAAEVDQGGADAAVGLQDWARARIAQGQRQLKKVMAQAEHSLAQAHRARIRAKRLRYGIEALQPLLPKRRAMQWHQHASQVQADIGSARDRVQALAIVTGLTADPGLLEFLRGYAVGVASP